MDGVGLVGMEWVDGMHWNAMQTLRLSQTLIRVSICAISNPIILLLYAALAMDAGDVWRHIPSERKME